MTLGKWGCVKTLPGDVFFGVDIFRALSDDNVLRFEAHTAYIRVELRFEARF